LTALLELRRNREAEQLAQENEKNVQKNECKLQCVAVSSEPNVAGGGEMDVSRGETVELSNMSITSAGIGVSADAEMTGLEHIPKLNNAEQGDQSVCVTLPPNVDQEVQQLNKMKLNEIENCDIDVIDLSHMTVQCSRTRSNQHVPVCFEVCLLHMTVPCTSKYCNVYILQKYNKQLL